MQYLIAFLHGILTFISPCILPLIPVFIAYLAGTENTGEKPVSNTLAFAFGFSIVFTLLGASASAAGYFLNRNLEYFRYGSGLFMILIGLNFLGIIKIGFLNRSAKLKEIKGDAGFYRSLLFGFTFAFAWTPCITAFLGNTLILASTRDTITAGAVLLFIYSLGLGIPFVIVSLLYDKLNAAFDFIKKHHKPIRTASGVLLIISGLLVFFDYMKYITF